MEDDGSKATLRFKAKHGTCTVTIYGPRIGWAWTKTNYFRWKVDTKNVGKWVAVAPDRECDQVHLLACVKDVQKFFKARDVFQQQNYGQKC